MNGRPLLCTFHKLNNLVVHHEERDQQYANAKQRAERTEFSRRLLVPFIGPDRFKRFTKRLAHDSAERPDGQEQHDDHDHPRYGVFSFAHQITASQQLDNQADLSVSI